MKIRYTSWPKNGSKNPTKAFSKKFLGMRSLKLKTSNIEVMKLYVRFCRWIAVRLEGEVTNT
jgi:hypothetical protein